MGSPGDDGEGPAEDRYPDCGPIPIPIPFPPRNPGAPKPAGVARSRLRRRAQ